VCVSDFLSVLKLTHDDSGMHLIAVGIRREVAAWAASRSASVRATSQAARMSALKATCMEMAMSAKLLMAAQQRRADRVQIELRREWIAWLGSATD
jgi:hypothetical protein